jgi:hypothetical protein
MDIQKEKDLYLKELLEREVISKDEFDDIEYIPEVNSFHSNYLSVRFIEKIDFGWSAWQAKAQAVPEGFILVKTADIAKLAITISRIDLMTYSESRSDNEKLAWQNVAEKIEAMIEAQEPAND